MELFHFQIVCAQPDDNPKQTIYKIDELKETLAVLEEKNNALKREVSSYTNYEGIDLVAKGTLKMIYPKSENIVYLVE